MCLLLIVVAPLVLSDFRLALLSKFLTFAIVALAIDLAWGYTGMLSLGHGVFFGLGAYALAMYLKLEAAKDGLPDFMGWSGLRDLPWFWVPFGNPWFALLMVVVLPGVLAASARLPDVPGARPGRLLLDHHPGAGADRDAGLRRAAAVHRRHQRHDQLQHHVRLRSDRELGAVGALRATVICLGLTYLAAALVDPLAGGLDPGGDPRRREPAALLRLRPGHDQAGRVRASRR